MKSVLSFLLSFALVAVVAYFGLRWFEYRSLFYPLRDIAVTPADVNLDYESIDFVAEDNTRLHGWWIPHPEARGTVLLCHGNAGNISHRLDLVLELWNDLQVNWFLFDYRGYGKSRGRPSEKGLYRDARAAYEVVRAQYGDADEPPVVVYGRSLGGAVALQLALDKPVRALVIESAFSSAVDVGESAFPILPVRVVMKYRFEADRRAPRVEAPKLFAHSKQDEIIPYRLGRALYEAAAEPRTFVELRGGHNDWPWNTTPGYRERLAAFVRQHLPGAGPLNPENTEIENP